MLSEPCHSTMLSNFICVSGLLKLRQEGNVVDSCLLFRITQCDQAVKVLVNDGR